MTIRMSSGVSTKEDRPLRILVATDLTTDSDEAFRQALAYGDDKTTKFAVCHVTSDASSDHGFAAESRLRRSLHEQADSFLPTPAQVFLDQGRTHAAILRRGAIWGADLIVVGSRVRDGRPRVPDDSVAELVVRHTALPVLVARVPGKRGTFLVASDLTDPTVPAMVAGAALARQRHGRLVVMHAIDFDSVAVSLEELVLAVLEPGAKWNLDDELRARAEGRLRAGLATCHADGETRIAPGSAASAVVGMATELDAELVVVGAHERGRFGRLALSSVAEHIVRTAPCSVLAVRMAA